MSPAVLALILLPFFLWWAESWVDRPSEDEKVFRPVPPLRLIYPGGLILFGWGISFYASVALDPRQDLGWNDWLGLVLFVAFLAMTLITWPATVKLGEAGLFYRRLFLRNFMAWSEVEATATGVDGTLMIYGRSGKNFEINRLTQGREQLKTIIEKKLS